MADQRTTVAELRDVVRQFVAERNWEQFHTPRNLATSVVIEAAELLENFQWLRDGEELTEGRRQAVSKEIADVFIYLVLLSRDLRIDLVDVAREKLDENVKRFPITEAKGRAWSNKPGLGSV